MADLPNVPDKNSIRSPASTLGLAERFGMTRESVEGILGETHREYSSSMTNDESIVGDGRMTNKGGIGPSPTPAAIPNAPVVVRNPNGGFMASILVLLLLGVGIALTFHQGCFEQRSQVVKQANGDTRSVARSVDTIQNLLSQEQHEASAPPVSPTQVAPGQVPPEALTVPRETPGSHAGTSESGRAANTAGNSGEAFTTTSNFDAQEKLAELRANGEKSAHVTKTKRRGVTSYEIHPR